MCMIKVLKKSNRLVLLTVCACLLGPSLNAQSDLLSMLTQDTTAQDDTSTFLNTYYMAPRPRELLAVVRSFLRDQEFLNDVRHLMPVVHLVAIVAHNDPTVLEGLKNVKNEYDGHAFDVISEIITQAEDFSPAEPLSPFHLDFIWAEFLATGSQEPVKKIISALGVPLPEKNGNYSDEEKNVVFTVTGAQWSLTSNIRQHQRVREIVEQEAANASGILKEKLEEILASAQNQTAPESEGNVY